MGDRCPHGGHLSNENVETEEDRTQYQIDTCVAVREFLESTVCPNGGQTANQGDGGRFIEGKTNLSKGIGSRQISDFLGTHNWSKSTVANLLKIHRNNIVQTMDNVKSI